MAGKLHLKHVKRFRRWVLSVLGVSLLRLVSKYVPLEINQAIGATLAGAVAVLKPRTRRVASVNLALCLPEVSEADRKEIMRRSFRELGKLAFEADYLWRLGKPGIRALVREVEGEEIRNRAESGGGVVYATPHLGCWEVAGLYISLDRPIHCLYKKAPFGFVENFISGGRKAAGLRLCPASVPGIKQLLRGLTAGENVGILPDQVPPRGHGINAPFFGRPAYTMTLLVKLARRAPVIFAYAKRLPRGRGYRLCFSEPPPEIYDASPSVAAAAINTEIERLVRRCPEQYFWSYRRFSDPVIYARKPA